ncbi:MAG: TatD family hydrolase [Clostridia bacterium]|nr:TatD family hydrolase [Clostridia bacterium]
MSHKLFDTHAHYYDARFAKESEGADVLLAEIFAGDVDTIVNVGTSLENAPICLAMAQKWQGMYAAVGIHPSDCADYAFESLERFAEFLEEHRDFKAEKIVAIGEIGFDYYWEPYDKEKQRFFFEGQMALAEKYDLPVIIHDREAHGDSFETVLRFPNVRGVFHSYSGSVEMARELVRRGWYISFSGVVTFKNATRVREVVASVPLDRLLIETDCPYLAPHPMRGKLNHSGYLHHTAEAIAEVFGKTPDEIADITHKNADTLFGL